MITAAIISLGCNKHLVDSEIMAGTLEKGGIKIIENPENADVIIVNTCGFIEDAKTEAVDTIFRMAEYKKEMVAVDKDALDFLKVIYFGTITDPFEAASFRAYRDFNRTLRFGDMGAGTRIELRKQATAILRERIADIAEETHMTQEEFDAKKKELLNL